MIQSMTGYGRGVYSRDGREATVELKSVNHRYLDVSMRLPRHIAFLEDALRKRLAEHLSRGHVDVYVYYRNMREDARIVEVDTALFNQYVDAARMLSEQLGVNADLNAFEIMKMNDVVTVSQAEEDREAVLSVVMEAAAMAIEELKAMRRVEGESLCADILGRTEAVMKLGEHIAVRAPLVATEYRDKLNERIAQLLEETQVDRARLATEIALFADKVGIDEEIARLNSHIAQMREALQSCDPAGRKLDFIVQEMNRELNTIGSKANDIALTNAVLAGKVEVEKIREQVQNVE